MYGSTTRFTWSLGLVLALAGAEALAQAPQFRFDAADVLVDHKHRFEALADLDGDGDDDILDWWWWNNDFDWVEITAWLNDGTGQLTEAWSQRYMETTSGSYPPVQMAVGDLNGDALTDFALSKQSRIWVFTSNGALEPTLVADFEVDDDAGVQALSFKVDDLVIADFDDDGLGDLAILGDNPETIQLRLNAGAGQGFTFSGNFDASDGMLSPNPPAKLLFVVEADGDGLPDLMTWSSRWVDLFSVVDGAVTSAQFIEHGLFGGGSTSPFKGTFGDIDGDGDGDVVMFRTDTGMSSVLRRTGPATFAVEAPRLAGPATNLCDVDGDGDLDGVCCGGSGTYFVDNEGPANFEVALNDGTGEFAPSFRIRSMGGHHIAGVSDMDGDGDLDMVGGRTIYFADGPLTANPQPALADEPLTQHQVCDGDADGDPDLFFGLGSMHRNDGQGNCDVLSMALPEAPVEGWQFLGPGHPGDFDGDGDEDLVVSLISGFSQPGIPIVERRHLLRNHGGGHLEDAGPAAPEGATVSQSYDLPESSRVLDLDLDGDLDLLGRWWGETFNHILWNDGTGWFPTSTDFPYDTVVGAADADHDGVADLLISSYDSAGVAFGLGDGTYGDLVPIPDNFASDTDENMSVVFDDLDLDGELDAVVVAAEQEGYTFSRLMVHYGVGAGAFGPAVNILPDLGFDPWAQVMLADVNGDGRRDLLASPQSDASGSTTLVLNTGGGFRLQPLQAILPTAFADMDGDGDLDLLSDRWVKNPKWTPPEDGRRVQLGMGAGMGCDIVATLGATGPFRVGETVELRARGLEPGVLAALQASPAMGALIDGPVVTASEGDAPTTTLGTHGRYSVLALFETGGDLGLAGSGRFSHTFVVTPAMAEMGALTFRVAFRDPCQPGQVTLSNRLELDFE